MDFDEMFSNALKKYFQNLWMKDYDLLRFCGTLYSQYFTKLNYMLNNKEYFEKLSKSAYSVSGKRYLRRLNKFEYAVILCSILNGVEYHKDNYENFCCIVDDVIKLKIEDKKPTDVYYFLSGIYLDVLMGNSYYKDMPNYRKYMVKTIANLDEDELMMLYAMYDEMHGGMYLWSKQINPEYRAKVLDSRVGQLLNKQPDNEMFYSDILLVGEGRYFYINEKIKEIEDNVHWRKIIFNNIKGLNIDMFDEINIEDAKDSFIVIMDKIFDSDSYYELFSKLRVLSEANRLYSLGDKNASFEMIDNIDNDCYKDKYLGKIVCYPTNTMNVVNKPKKIIDRMKYLYGRIDDSISYDFMDDVHDSCIDYPSFCTRFDIAVDMERNKTKYKLKRLFKK